MLIAIVEESWELLVDAAPFLLFGFFLAGLIRSFVPLDTVKRHLGHRGFGSALKAALIGIPLPLCSCSVLPTAMALRKQGADKSAVTSFLVSTPETGVDSIAVSFALLDPLMAIFRPIAAFVAALTAGGLELLFGKREEERTFVPLESEQGATCDNGCCGCDTPASVTLGGKIKAGFRFAFVDLIDDLAGWMVAGLLLAGTMIALLPDGIFKETGGGDWVMMPLMLVAGVPLYICATSSTPLAAALIMKGVSPGAALVFLLAGPATNIGTLMALRSELGGRSTLLYLAAICVSAITMGIGLNALYAMGGIDPTATIGAANELFPRWLGNIAAMIFLALASATLYRNLKRRG